MTQCQYYGEYGILKLTRCQYNICGKLTIFYGSNTWNYTPLGRIDGVTADSLLAVFGEGDIAVELLL